MPLGMKNLEAPGMTADGAPAPAAYSHSIAPRVRSQQKKARIVDRRQQVDKVFNPAFMRVGKKGAGDGFQFNVSQRNQS